MSQPSGDFGQENLRVRAGDLVAGRYLVTVGGADGSDLAPCPADRKPAPRLAVARTRSSAAGPGTGPVGPVALGAAPGDLPLLDREEDVATLLGKLAEGRSVRLVGEAGSGRSALLAAVAEGAGDLAPHGVLRLSGHRRTAADLLQDLYAAAYQSTEHRPDATELPTLLGAVGAVVVIDEVVPDGAELEQLLATAPECAFLIAVAPGSGGALPVGSRLEDHPVTGLSRTACLALTARLAGRPLDETERAWAVDLWFESQGLPLRFVQAAALLRRRDAEVDALLAAEEDRHDLFGGAVEPDADADPAVREAELRATVPLPSVAEAAAPALLLLDGLSESAHEVLRLAVALGGECPTAPHLPALIDVDHGESALRELVEAGLAESTGGHHRLTPGVLEALAPVWGIDRMRTEGAAQHFSWWLGHGSVSAAQIAAEAEVVLGALHADRAAGRPEAVLGLARSAAPALALALRWGAWREALDLGGAMARELGSQRDEAWFLHESGVYWFCLGEHGRARAALEAAGALRAMAGDSRAGLASRRLLTLLQQVELEPVAAEAPTQVTRRPVIRALAERSRQSASVLRGWSRRNLVLAASGLVVLAVVGTAIGVLGSGSSGSPGPGATGGDNGVSGSQLTGDGASTSAQASGAATTASGSPSASGSASGSASASVSATASASASASRGHSGSPSATPDRPGSTPTQPTAPTTQPPTPSKSPTPSPSPSTSSASPSASPTTPSPSASTSSASAS
ncbi:ATP-binding protein [Kitasatospora sp. NPDC058965]|uniref:ATP-binding protein n=1 Tax=Kitasatospora sp. NPDC058965 TaxID=3346682 RepID=UPI00368645E9